MHEAVEQSRETMSFDACRISLVCGPFLTTVHPRPEHRPQVDSAFNDCLFMWDSAFILMFARYGRRAHDFQRTLDNFYAKQVGMKYPMLSLLMACVLNHAARRGVR